MLILIQLNTFLMGFSTLLTLHGVDLYESSLPLPKQCLGWGEE